ncbi:host cell division inhibitor Icd-like protein [Serratia sp. BIGb0163]|uniref:host cell division inhibitor Icd-like protein n=1 Tax=Serratia sp. BIGb0163 TaxID=2940613 RepID=UPI00216812EA|nr:host cell division inhibitor Icd-like protein [Serratia sp. BIGb0163]
MRSIEHPGASYGLPPRPALRYSPPAVAQSAAGRENPSYSMATPHAPSVFFFVAALVRSFFAQWFICYCGCQTMVAQAGQPSGWPVFIEAGFSPPSGLPPLRENFGGSNNHYSMEAATMATILTPTHPEFCFLFAAIRRTALTAAPCMLRTVADSEHNARRLLARDYILSFAGRLPAQGVA